jgi:hypothetical protein
MNDDERIESMIASPTRIEGTRGAVASLKKERKNIERKKERR